MNQPYIFKKQIITLIILVIILVILTYCEEHIFFIPTFYYLINVVAITFVPSFRRKYKYPWIVHCLIYYFPMILPILFVDIHVSKSNHLVGIAMGLLGSVFLLVTNYKHNIEYISSKNYLTLSSLTLKEFVNKISTNIYIIICEEIFYRYFIISYLSMYIGGYSIVVSTLGFVFSHFINRWANVVFGIRSYFYQFMIGMVTGAVFYYTRSIWACIIAHLIFNSSEFIVFYKCYKNSKNCQNSMFDDY